MFPEIREFTINQSKDSMLRSLFLARADVVCVSCYIWNISIVEDLITEYHKNQSENKDLAWRAGGFVPCRGDAGTVSVPCRNYERRGRSDFPGNSSLLIRTRGNGMEGKTLEEIHGITYRDADGAVKSNPWRPVMDLSEVDFPYANLKKFENRDHLL